MSSNDVSSEVSLRFQVLEPRPTDMRCDEEGELAAAAALLMVNDRADMAPECGDAEGEAGDEGADDDLNESTLSERTERPDWVSEISASEKGSRNAKRRKTVERLASCQ